MTDTETEDILSDHDAMVKIVRKLDRGCVLVRVEYLDHGPFPVRLHFRKDG